MFVEENLSGPIKTTYNFLLMENAKKIVRFYTRQLYSFLLSIGYVSIRNLHLGVHL